MEEERKRKKGKRMADKNLKVDGNKTKMTTGKKVIIASIIILSIIAILLGAFIGIVLKKVELIEFSHIDKSQIDVNENLYSEVSENVTKDEFENIKNVALFGVDGGRSDAIIIASINQNNNSIKLLSIPRDTYVKVEGHGKTKINHAYAYGKEQLALKTINSNFGLNISEYVTVNFKGLINVINKIGGIQLEITKEEKEYINQYVEQSYALSNKKTQLLNSYGNVTLTGEQALTHSRNRTIGSDFAREERQRDVITAAMNKVSKKSLTELWNLSDSILKEVRTNLNIAECMGIVAEVLPNAKSYLNNVTSEQVPSAEIGKGEKIDGLYYFVCDLEEASQVFKDTIYGK